MVTYEKWGEHGGKDVFLYKLENESGMKVEVTNFGCGVTSVQYHGIDVALGFDNLEAYEAQTCYLGVTAGRAANRIRDARFTLLGTEFQVSGNIGKHHLHGGFKGFDKVLWDVDNVDPKGNAVRFSYLSRDGEEGYPGNLTVKVTYSLDEECGLRIGYEAVTDQATIVNLTNHTYFNLSGHNSGTVENQQVKIHSNAFLEVDSESIPTGNIVPVDGTPFDFRDFHKIGERIEDDDIQMKYGGGYDHNWILDGGQTGDLKPAGINGQTDDWMKLAAEAWDEKTGIRLQVYTTMPGVQFYSGNSLNERSRGKDGAIYGRRCGFCLETQFYPDAIHHPEFPQPVLLPGQTYRHRTVYKLK